MRRTQRGRGKLLRREEKSDAVETRGRVVAPLSSSLLRIEIEVVFCL